MDCSAQRASHGDECRHDRLRRRHRRRIRRGPGRRGLRLPLRSSHDVNDTSTCSVVSRSRCRSAGRGVARAVPVNGLAGHQPMGCRGRACHRRRWPPPPVPLPPRANRHPCLPSLTRTEPPRRSVRADSQDLAPVPQRRPSDLFYGPVPPPADPQCRRHRVIHRYCRRPVPRRGSRIQQTLTTPRMGPKAQSIATPRNRRAAPHQEPPERCCSVFT